MYIVLYTIWQADYLRNTLDGHRKVYKSDERRRSTLPYCQCRTVWKQTRIKLLCESEQMSPYFRLIIVIVYTGFICISNTYTRTKIEVRHETTKKLYLFRSVKRPQYQVKHLLSFHRKLLWINFNYIDSTGRFVVVVNSWLLAFVVICFLVLPAFFSHLLFYSSQNRDMSSTGHLKLPGLSFQIQ